MSTRSEIIVHRTDGKWARIYCHHDGYLDYNGAVLYQHYNSQERAEAVVAPGDMSSLAERCDKPEGHSYENRAEGCSVYYGRDRGETGVDTKLGDTLEEVWPKPDSWAEFVYVWTDGKWWVGDPDKESKMQTNLIELGDALAGKKTIHPLIKVFGLPIGRH